MAVVETASASDASLRLRRSDDTERLRKMAPSAIHCHSSCILLVFSAAAQASATTMGSSGGIGVIRGAAPVPGHRLPSGLPLVNLGGVSSRPSNWSVYLQIGGRGIDTALTYGDATQKKVGAAISGQTDVPRGEIFLTTKVPCCPNKFGPYPGAHCTVPEFNGTMTADMQQNTALLGTTADLTLMHWPCITAEQTLAAWRGMEAGLAAGHTRAIGVSNFNASLLAKLLPQMTVKPTVNQCGHSIGHHTANQTKGTTAAGYSGSDDGTVAFCQAHNISYAAYTPLGGLSGLDVFKDPTVAAVGKSHGVSAAQVALRWLVQQNIAVVTAADTAEYIKEDIDLFSFALTEAEMSTLAAL